MDKYSRTLTEAISILRSHISDNRGTNYNNNKEKKEKSKSSKKSEKEVLDNTFAQLRNQGYCCGQVDHILPPVLH